MFTSFDVIEFDPQWHRYVLNGKVLRSVTTVLKDLKTPFDADYWAAKKAEERGVTVAEIRAEWDKKRDESIAKGNAVHAHIEQVLKGESPAADPFLGLLEPLPEVAAFDALWQKFSPVIEPVHVEWVIGDEELGIAGTVDALFRDRRTGKHHIWDWKTNSRFNTDNKFQRLKAPFDDVPECELTNYSLQVSLYRLIIERNTGLDMGDSYIVHFSRDGQFTLHKARDYRARLLDWLG